jgi:hypothetical protein
MRSIHRNDTDLIYIYLTYHSIIYIDILLR